MSARYILIIILFFVGWLACKLIWNPRPRQRFESPLTRVVWTFWDQGFENAPIACQMALKSWKYYNPSWTVIPLDRKAYTGTWKNRGSTISGTKTKSKPNLICSA